MLCPLLSGPTVSSSPPAQSVCFVDFHCFLSRLLSDIREALVAKQTINHFYTEILSQSVEIRCIEVFFSAPKIQHHVTTWIT